MKLKDKNIGFALTGSHCTLDETIPVLEDLVDSGANIYPILSESVLTEDTKFGPAMKWINRIKEITEQPIIDSIVEAEPIGPDKMFDLLIIAPCTGNTLSKIANGIIDETVVMAAKAQLRNQRPVLISIATNDGLGLNARNLSTLLNTENIYFVPFGQDNPEDKPNSIISRLDLLKKAAELALEKEQIQPVLIEYRGI
ncbi:MAG: dipicolinate synthase subunit B [Halanaerobiaceae bacterium]